MLKWFAQSVTRTVITHQRSHREWKSLCLDQTLQTATTVWDEVLRFETEKSREKAFDGNFRNLSPSRRRDCRLHRIPPYQHRPHHRCRNDCHILGEGGRCRSERDHTRPQQLPGASGSPVYLANGKGDRTHLEARKWLTLLGWPLLGAPYSSKGFWIRVFSSRNQRNHQVAFLRTELRDALPYRLRSRLRKLRRRWRRYP